MARRNDHSRDEIKALALDAAEALLIEEGVAGVSARKVATRIGYTAGSLYQVFANLDDLYWQINLRTLKRLNSALFPRQSLGAAEQLAGLASDYVTFAKQHHALWSLLFEHRSASSCSMPEALSQQIEHLFQEIEVLLARLNPRADSEQVRFAARAVWGGVHGVAVLTLRDKLFLQQTTAEQAILASLIENFINGWQQESGDACTAAY